nr:hypothetical protein [Tanacetum cinerariifolium]GEV89628.1 hypothetical protein [Tanacetum cinerariifolium]
MHKAFPLLGIEFLLAEEVPTVSEKGCHCQKKREATARKIALLSKSRRNCQSKSNDSFANVIITLEDPIVNSFQKVVSEEVIEFGDSYKVPTSTASTTTTDTPTGETGKKSGRTVTLTAEDIQKKKNDFIDVEIEQDDLNQKFLTSLAPEWLMHTIVWRNRSDLDTMSLDDLYNHLKVYESEVQKKLQPNPQNMAFISSAKHISENEDGNTACIPTASTNVPTASASIDEDDMEEMDIKWNMALLSVRADKFWKKTGKKIIIQGSDVVGFDKSKVECFNCHKMGHFARECRAPRSQDRGRRDNYRQGSKAEEQAPKALMAIDGVG